MLLSVVLMLSLGTALPEGERCLDPRGAVSDADDARKSANSKKNDEQIEDVLEDLTAALRGLVACEAELGSKGRDKELELKFILSRELLSLASHYEEEDPAKAAEFAVSANELIDALLVLSQTRSSVRPKGYGKEIKARWKERKQEIERRGKARVIVICIRDCSVSIDGYRVEDRKGAAKRADTPHVWVFDLYLNDGYIFAVDSADSSVESLPPRLVKLTERDQEELILFGEPSEEEDPYGGEDGEGGEDAEDAEDDEDAEDEESTAGGAGENEKVEPCPEVWCPSVVPEHRLRFLPRWAEVVGLGVGGGAVVLGATVAGSNGNCWPPGGDANDPSSCPELWDNNVAAGALAIGLGVGIVVTSVVALGIDEWRVRSREGRRRHRRSERRSIVVIPSTTRSDGRNHRPW